MELNTASSVISLARELEETSARFYEGLAGQYPASEEMFTGYAKENRKFIKQFETAYYGVITDALEGCFAFKIKPDQYELNVDAGSGQNINEATDRAIQIEDTMWRFYTDAAEQSQSLMADVPRVFSLIAKKIVVRKQQLESSRS